MSSSIFLLQIFFCVLFWLQDFIIVARPLLAAVSINGLNLDQVKLLLNDCLGLNITFHWILYPPVTGGNSYIHSHLKRTHGLTYIEIY